MKKILNFLLIGVTSIFVNAKEIPMQFCGLRLGQQVPEGIRPTSKTEVYYGYDLPTKEKILDFNQYSFHASLVTKTITNAGAGYVTQSVSETASLFQRTCNVLGCNVDDSVGFVFKKTLVVH